MNEFLERSFKSKLIRAAEEGILLAVKWGIIVLVILWAYNFSINTRTLAINGDSAARAIVEFQKVGALPPLKDK